MAGDSVIVIGAASKGIIQRDQQHNVQVYKSQYQANPFENMTQDEIDRYKVEVEKKAKGEPGKNDWSMIRGLAFNQYQVLKWWHWKNMDDIVKIFRKKIGI